MKSLKSLLILTFVLVFVLSVPSIAQAITYGDPDGDAHPYVGVVAVYDASFNFMFFCSGTLITPNYVLTAGHCVSQEMYGTPVHAKVWFDSYVSVNIANYYAPGGYPGTPIANPAYRWALPNTNDVGLVHLDQARNVPVYGKLPTLGYLDVLATKRGLQDVTFTLVGYGYVHAKPPILTQRRNQAVAHLINLRSALTDGYNIQYSNNPGSWSKDAKSGGQCFGDSGGPVLYSDNTIVAVISFGNNNCTGSNFGYRVDTQSARAYLGVYVTLP